MSTTLTLEKYVPSQGKPTLCPTCGERRKGSAQIHVRGRTHGPRGGCKVQEFGAGEYGLIMAGRAADAATEGGVQVGYRGSWSRREKHGPWSVNKAMRCR